MPKSHLACLALALIFLCGCWRKSAPNKPLPLESTADFTGQSLKYKDHNLVFVSFDALQAAHVGCLGNERDATPALDKLARESCAFTNTISVASWTVPASMTWFTGVYPSEHGMTNKFAVYNDSEQTPAKLRDKAPNLATLADILRQEGYATVGFTGNAGVSGAFGYNQGFDVYDHEEGKFGGFDHSIPAALAWLEANKDQKFFLFLHGYDAHGQNTPEEGFDYRFVDRRYDKKYNGDAREQEALREEGLEKGELTLREQDVKFWRAIYDEKIQRADERFQRFLDEFDQLGLSGNTLFVVTSDHGTEFYEHRRLDHGFTLYNEQLHVPLFIRLPGQSGCKVVPERVSSIDLLPTVLDLLDVPIPEHAAKQMRGTSLVPAMQGETPERNVFSETDYREYTYKRSIVSPGGWKLIYTLESQTRELFNLDDDPGELHNLATAEPERADELQRQLFAHFKSIGHDLTARRWERGLNPVYNSQAKPR